MTNADICLTHESCDGTESDCRDSSGLRPGTGRGGELVSCYAVVAATSRSVVFVCDATSKAEAIAAAVVALDRTRAPASWDAWPVSDLPTDLQSEAENWRAEADAS